MLMSRPRMMAFASRPDAGRALLQAALGEGALMGPRSEELWFPMVLLDLTVIERTLVKWVLFAVAGAMIGYAMGFVGGLLVRAPLEGYPHLMAILAGIYGLMGLYGLAVALAGALSPLPLSAVAWFSGAFGVNPLVFALGVLLGRMGRYAVISALLWRGGPGAKEGLERNFYAISMMLALGVFLVLVLGLFFLGKLF